MESGHIQHPCKFENFVASHFNARRNGQFGLTWPDGRTEGRTDGRTDRRTDGRTDGQVNYYMPPDLSIRGHKKSKAGGVVQLDMIAVSMLFPTYCCVNCIALSWFDFDITGSCYQGHGMR